MLGRNITAFPGVRPRDWTSQELAEFYRVESALIQAGMRVDTDRGLTDEGDPWFVFCREEDSEPVAHFARIDGQYLIASPAYDGVARGYDFRSMVQNLISRHKLSPRGGGERANVFMHPAALLIVVIGAAFFKTPSEAKAGEAQKAAAVLEKSDGGSVGAAAALGFLANNSQSQAGQAWSEEQLAIVTAVALVVSGYDQASVSTVGNQSSFETIDNGFISEHGSLVQSVLSELETDGAGDFTPIKTVAFSTGGLSAEVASTLDLVVKLNHIPLASQALSADSAGATTAAAPSLGNNSEYAFLATKVWAGAAPGSVAAPLAALVDVQQSANHIGATTSQSSANVVYHEEATVIASLPASLSNLSSYVNVAAQLGSAGTFLFQNNIFITLQFNSAVQMGADVSSTLTNSASASSAPLTASDSHHAGATQSVSSSSQNVSSQTASSQDIVMSLGGAGKAGEVLTAAEFVQTLDLFLAETPAASVVVSQQKYVFFGTQASTGAAPLMEAVTMTFNDGSSISIVGQQQTLHDLVSHVQ